MKLSEAKKIIKALGMKIDKSEDGEYRVAFLGKSEAKEERGAYYTDDLEDALGTAKDMARRANPPKPPTQEWDR